MNLVIFNPTKIKLIMLKRVITVGELIAACITVLGCVLTFWVSTNVRLSALEIHQQQETSNSQETRESFKEVLTEIKALNQGQNEIKLQLKDKQDRK